MAFIPIDIYNFNKGITTITDPQSGWLRKVNGVFAKKEDFFIFADDPNSILRSTARNSAKNLYVKVGNDMFSVGSTYVVECKYIRSQNSISSAPQLAYEICNADWPNGKDEYESIQGMVVIPTNARGRLGTEYGERDILVRKLEARDLANVDWNKVEISFDTERGVVRGTLGEILGDIINGKYSEPEDPQRTETWVEKLTDPIETDPNGTQTDNISVAPVPLQTAPIQTLSIEGTTNGGVKSRTESGPIGSDPLATTPSVGYVMDSGDWYEVSRGSIVGTPVQRKHYFSEDIDPATGEPPVKTLSSGPRLIGSIGGDTIPNPYANKPYKKKHSKQHNKKRRK